MKTVLHVGCGSRKASPLPRRFDDWKEVRLDIDERTEPDVVGDLRAMPEVKDKSMDALCCFHSLEHVRAHEVPVALAEFKRVLKPGGLLMLRVPDLTQAAAAVADGRPEQPLYQSPGGPISAVDILFGHRGFVKQFGPAMAHGTGFTKTMLEDRLTAAGFTGVKVSVNRFDLWAEGRKP